MKPVVRVSVALIALSLAAPVFAIEDEATGLGVELPESEFVVEPSALSGQYTANFGVNTVSGEPKLMADSIYARSAFSRVRKTPA